MTELFKSLGWGDRLLAPAVLAAMILGVGLGNAVSAEQIDRIFDASSPDATASWEGVSIRTCIGPMSGRACRCRLTSADYGHSPPKRSSAGRSTRYDLASNEQSSMGDTASIVPRAWHLHPPRNLACAQLDYRSLDHGGVCLDHFARGVNGPRATRRAFGWRW